MMREIQRSASPDVRPVMAFEHLPPNDFTEFIQTYYNECRSRIPEIEAIAGKWTFDDLLPGISDFDTRFICSNSMTADGWCRMSMAVGQVHLDLCKKYPKWARILEHLPGINLTWDELMDESTYYPEYNQWTFYHCSQPKLLNQAKEKLTHRLWNIKDEYFYLKRFLNFYGPYNRSIDPAVNLGPYENRYPLHSRLMHYFTPPVQSAVSILKRKAIMGKMEALQIAQQIFPETNIFNEVIDIVKQNYEVSELYEESTLSELEIRLFDGLKLVASRLARAITILPNSHNTSLEDWKESLKQVPIDPSLLIFDNAKFARLMKGRLYFYTHVPSHFDSIWCIQNELKRIGNNFFRVPFRIFWEITRRERIENPAQIVSQLSPDILTSEEVKHTLVFDRLTRVDCKGREIEIAKKIIDIFNGFFHALYKISQKVRELKKVDLSK